MAVFFIAIGKKIRFEVDPKELTMRQADSTGIPIRTIRKRGKELKVFVQLKRTGGIWIAGLAIGNHEGQSEELFGPLPQGLKKLKQFLLFTDGDTNILKALRDRVKVLFQRCLWHTMAHSRIDYGNNKRLDFARE